MEGGTGTVFYNPGLCQLPPGSTRVHDADEEVFLLYTSVASRHVQDSTHAFRGLGYLDSHQDVLTLEFTVQIADTSSRGTEDGALDTFHSSSRHKRHAKRQLAKHKPRLPEEKTISIQLAQDKTALRSRKGDTGSVLWRACFEFAQLILRQYYARTPDSLFSTKLSEAQVLELGAGTGLLSIVLSPLVRHYTVTDIVDLVPLIAKNLSLNGISHSPSTQPVSPNHTSVTVDALDWTIVHAASPPARRALLAPYPAADLLLVVDCIYHPSLLPALISTLDSLTVPGHTTVVVVVELRAEDVIREFLELWLASGNEQNGEECQWEIWHANIEGMMDGPYAMWIGWKKPLESI